MQVIDDHFLIRHRGVSKTFGANSALNSDLLSNPTFERIAELSMTMLTRGEFGDVVKEVVVYLIQHMLPIDWLLFLSEHWYREHRHHQLRAAVLAVWLLHELYPNQETFGEHPREAVAGALWVSAMLHDHGYALSRLARLRSVLATEERAGVFVRSDDCDRRFANLKACYAGLFATSLADRFCVSCDLTATAEVTKSQLDEEVRETIAEFLGTEAVGLESKLVERLCTGDLYDHGLWSAVNLSATLCQFGMPWTEPERKAVQMVIHAMAIHNRKDFRGYDLNVCINPIAGILVLADELQEWERRAVPDAEPLDIHCRVEFEFADENRMLIRFSYPADDLARAKSSRESVEHWKKSAIEARVSGAKGLPNIEVSVQEEPSA